MIIYTVSPYTAVVSHSDHIIIIQIYSYPHIQNIHNLRVTCTLSTTTVDLFHNNVARQALRYQRITCVPVCFIIFHHFLPYYTVLLHQMITYFLPRIYHQVTPTRHHGLFKWGGLCTSHVPLALGGMLKAYTHHIHVYS